MCRQTNKKGLTPLSIVFLSFGIFVCIVILLLFQFNGIIGIIQSKETIYLSKELDDSGSELVSFLGATTDKKTSMRILGESLAVNGNKDSIKALEEIASKLGSGYKVSFGDSVSFVTSTSSGTCIYDDLKTHPNNLRFPMPEGQRINSQPGWRLHPLENACKCHAGIDISGDKLEVSAAFSGTVESAKYSTSYGNWIIISHDSDWEGYRTVYAHLDEMYVEAGDYVDQGKIIGRSGSTGKVEGPNLHFELRDGNAFVNPCRYLQNAPSGCYVEDRCTKDTGRDVQHYTTLIPVPGGQEQNTVKPMKLMK